MRWTAKTSSLVHRDDVMPPTARSPYCCWMARNRVAANWMASSHDTTRQSSVMFSRTIGSSTRSSWVA
jgi:hypothetical protein